MNTTVYEIKNFLGVELECPNIRIEGADYELAERAAREFWSTKKPGDYGKGLASVADPSKAMRVGIAGQIAFARLYGLPLEGMNFRAGGDDGDFHLPGGWKLDVKTKTYWQVPDRCSIRTGGAYRLKSDLYVFASLNAPNSFGDDRKDRFLDILLCGWMTRRDVEICPETQSRNERGTHRNLEVYFSDLRPLETLEPYLDGTLEKSG